MQDDTYAFFCDRILELDSTNPQVASRLAKSLTNFRAFAEPAAGAIEAQLRRIAAKPNLSTDVAEVVQKSLATPTKSQL
jgi:aminopeptidase N